MSIGSELLFVAILFAAMAVVTWPVVAVRILGQAAPSAREIEVTRALSYALMFGFGTRAAAELQRAMSTIALKSDVLPRWFGPPGYLVGVVLLIVAFWEWVILTLPAWVALGSLFVVRRERARRQAI